MKPYSATPAVRMTPLAERAVAKLDAWLRDDTAGQFSNAVDQLREGVEHLMGCNGKECSCEDACGDGVYCESPVPCLECKHIREGDRYTRPLLDLLEEVEAREAALFEVA